ncbi:peroxynitrite isomerase THAP4-like isoform X2 [Patiria miniata]|uniref:THAP4-like heme-binding domain-containing protein n=1 Tax=Patiria miniata TaxID=46514 RepID=A0A913ZFQ6_PATMI|nr:peroxynitrite isomerase THAP4-like isoform X2 [Patiria miniata]
MFRTICTFARFVRIPTSTLLRQGGVKCWSIGGASSFTRGFCDKNHGGIPPCKNQGQAKMVEVHEGVRPLTWLLGQWESIEAKGSYPNTNSFNYTETLKVTHLGQPVLNFYSETWLEGLPFHDETGFIKMKQGTSRVAYICAQNIGLVEIEEGELDGTSIEFIPEEPSVLRTSFGTKALGATALKRTFRLDSEGILEQIVYMSTLKVPMTKHLYVKYKKKEA